MKRYILVALVMFLALNVTSCGGPKITTCVSNPKSENFICFNPTTKHKITQSPSQVDNWIFLSAADERSVLDACENRRGGVKVNVCVFSSDALVFSCYNEVSGQSNGFTFAKSENYIGISPVDEQILLTYCQSLKK